MPFGFFDNMSLYQLIFASVVPGYIIFFWSGPDEFLNYIHGVLQCNQTLHWVD